jgi:thiol-disulfide isomerase/thioredoxin
MIERLVITLLILTGLSLLWLGWRAYKAKIAQSIQPADNAAGLPTLLYFSADYCAPCKWQQTPIVDNLSIKYGERLVIKKYDVTEHPDLAGRYKVLTLPATIVLDGRGQVTHMNYGVASQAKLEAQLALSPLETTLSRPPVAIEFQT